MGDESQERGNTRRMPVITCAVTVVGIWWLRRNTVRVNTVHILLLLLIITQLSSDHVGAIFTYRAK